MKLSSMSMYARSKGVRGAAFWVVISGLLILLGGLGIVLGVYVQIALLLIIVFLFITSFVMHNFWAIADPQQKMVEMSNFMKNMALLGAALMLFLIPGPWILSVVL